MPRSLPFAPVALALAALAAGLACSATARATPDFPGVVVADLDLPRIVIDPPMGCTLCHTTDAGGNSLRPFGYLLQSSYGVLPYNEGSLKAALAMMETDQPNLIEDIKSGMDPNSDPDLGGRPQPLYGCAIAATATGPLGSFFPMGFAIFAAIGLTWRRTRRHSVTPRWRSRCGFVVSMSQRAGKGAGSQSSRCFGEVASRGDAIEYTSVVALANHSASARKGT